MLADDAVPAVAFAAVAAAVAFLIVVAVSLPPVAEALFDATFLVVVAVSSLHLPFAADRASSCCLCICSSNVWASNGFCKDCIIP